jgi:hypothetical protein
LAYIVHLVSVENSTLDRLSNPSKSDVKNIRDTCLDQPEKSVVADHRFEGYIIFSSTSILDKPTGYMNHVIKEGLKSSFAPATSIGTQAAHTVGPGASWLTC